MGESAGLRNRRTVVLGTLADLSSELDRLEAAWRAGSLRATGRREPGAIMFHLAVSIRGSFDGMPELRGAAPIWLRLVGPMVKGRVLTAPLRPGVRMSAGAERALWDDAADFADALALLCQQVTRLERATNAPMQPHPVFGRLSLDEWRRFHLRHAELHLSFLDPGTTPRPALG